MKIVIHGWLVFLALITALNPASANSVGGTEYALKNHQAIDQPSDKQTAPQSVAPAEVEIHVTATQSLHRRLVRIPAALMDRLAVEAMPVGHHRGQSIQLKRIQVSEDEVKIVGHRLISDWIPGHLQPAFWFEEVRVTFPRHYIAGSWDVQALQRELERLGIKIKPKPAAPKPTVQQLSG